MPSEIARYSPFGPRWLAVRNATTSPTKRGAEIVVEIKMLHPAETILANEVPDDAPVPSEV